MAQPRKLSPSPPPPPPPPPARRRRRRHRRPRLSLKRRLRSIFASSAGGMGNTPPQLRRDASLRCCVPSPLPRVQRHAISKRMNCSRQARLRSWRRRTSEAEVSWATVVDEAECGAAAQWLTSTPDASLAMLADEEDADSPMLRHFQNLCIRKVPKAGEVTSRAIAARSVRFCRMAGRTEVHGDGPATLAWLSLAASFEGQPREFMAELHKGTKREKQVLMAACVLAVNQIGGSSVFKS